jgi:thiol-disulfide isomerase/thioredoxin
VTKIRERAAGAAKRLTETANTLKLSDKAKWEHAEFGVPFTRPADAFDGRDDHTVYKNGTVLVEDGGKTLFLQTGELIQVGRAWKIVDGPSAGPAPMAGTVEASGGPVVTPEIKDFVAQLNELDKQAPNPPTVATLAAFNARRADLLEQIVAKLPEDKKEPWAKMLIDSHAGAAEGDKPGNKHIVRLQQWKEAMVRPGGNQTLAAYAAFRFLAAENSVALANIKDGNELGPIQDRWRAGLEEFIKNFPKSPDTPEAVLRLAMAYELSSMKDAETKARHWFDYLVKNHADHPHAAKAAGAIKRFDCEGKSLELTGMILGTSQQFNAATQKDKAIVVYYWASWSQSLAADAKKLQALLKDYGPKGLVVVTVSLDHDAKQAAETARTVGLPGTHLHAPGGLDGSPLAASYGILVAPHILITDKAGKITNRNGQIPTLEEDVKKLLEK